MEAEPEDAAFGRRNVVALKPAGRGFLTVVDFVASSAMDYSGSSGWEKADSSLNEGREDRIGHTVVVTRPKSSSDRYRILCVLYSYLFPGYLGVLFDCAFVKSWHRCCIEMQFRPDSRKWALFDSSVI